MRESLGRGRARIGSGRNGSYILWVDVTLEFEHEPGVEPRILVEWEYLAANKSGVRCFRCGPRPYSDLLWLCVVNRVEAHEAVGRVVRSLVGG